MRALLILTASVLVVLSGCVEWNRSAQFRGGSFPRTGQPSVELGEPSPEGFDEFDEPAAAPDTQKPASPDSAAPSEPRFEGPALPRHDLGGRRHPARHEERRSQGTPDTGPNAFGLSASNRPSLAWTPSFQSTQRRPINTLRAGAGRNRTMLIGSLHGDEPIAVALIDRLAEHARDNSQRWSGRTVLFVRTPNPDGLAGGARTNSRGVDLNRNFPTWNFRPNRRRRTGPRPGSEVETRAILRLLYTFRPGRVVHLKSTTDETGWVLYSRSASAVVRKFSGLTPLRLGELPPGAIAGSLESYATDVLSVELITIAVPAGSDADAIWRRYGDVLLRAAGATIQNSASDHPLRNRQKHGPWVAAGDDRETSVFSESTTQGVPQTGYFELPPPPGETLDDKVRSPASSGKPDFGDRFKRSVGLE